MGREERLFTQDGTGKGSQYIIWSRINEQTFLQDFFDSSDTRFTRLYAEYIPASELLLVKMTTKVLEQAYQGVDHMIMRKLIPMNNVDLQLQKTGHAEFMDSSRTTLATRNPSNRTHPCTFPRVAQTPGRQW